jgi:medium-chain acyl-[acyl-carrier-protein] hydrolase
MRLREPPYTDLTRLVDALADAIIDYIDRPFAFFGHSMGAIISFELARRLRRRDLCPAHLFVSGCRAPHLPRRSRRIYDLPEEEIVEELRRLNGTPREVLNNPELLHLVMPVLRADFKVVQTYVYTDEPPLDCRISAYGGLQDVDIKSQDIEEWRRHTTSAFQKSLFPGDHFFLHSSESLLLWKLSQQLHSTIESIDQ